MKDEAGPLWLLLENFFESLPIRPVWILLAVLVIVALVVLVRVSYERRK